MKIEKGNDGNKPRNRQQISTSTRALSKWWPSVWRFVGFIIFPLILLSILPSAFLFVDAHPVNRVISMVPPTMPIIVDDSLKEETDIEGPIGPEGEEDEVPEREEKIDKERKDVPDEWILHSRHETSLLELDDLPPYPQKQKCIYSVCSETTLFTYRRCCRNDIYSCCWFFRMWVIVVFGIFALKLFLTIFVSFFRCVCC
ncbi:unnamed protein product, partial [Mesorhabditis belari]|uniref:Uncharacterized protein n=1 Tax=Mesorhabditis belari TaxID=2138241 RepID=A0AAF3FF21_9BILA